MAAHKIFQMPENGKKVFEICLKEKELSTVLETLNVINLGAYS